MDSGNEVRYVTGFLVNTAIHMKEAQIVCVVYIL